MEMQGVRAMNTSWDGNGKTEESKSWVGREIVGMRKTNTMWLGGRERE